MELIFLKDDKIIHKMGCDLEYLQTLDLVDSISLKEKRLYIESKTLNVVTNRVYVKVTDTNNNVKNVVNNFTFKDNDKESAKLLDSLKQMGITVNSHP